jgi:hypothetical protein
METSWRHLKALAGQFQGRPQEAFKAAFGGKGAELIGLQRNI